MKMAQNPVPDDVYPSSTAAGAAIPLDAVRPLGYYVFTADYAFNLPEDVNLISFYSDVDCTVTFAGSTLNNQFTSNGFYALGGVAYELIVPMNVAVHFVEPGKAIVNLLQKWQQMTNIGTYYAS